MIITYAYTLSFVKVQGAKGPIFEDGPNFEMAFRLFHGQDGVVPLTGRSSVRQEKLEPEFVDTFNPLAAKAATISLSAFGGPFGFDFFSKKWKRQNNRSSKQESASQVVSLCSIILGLLIA